MTNMEIKWVAIAGAIIFSAICSTVAIKDYSRSIVDVECIKLNIELVKLDKPFVSCGK